MDDLTRIKGIGKAAAERLVAAGIDSFEKLAHDGLAGEHGVKVEWIAAAAGLLAAGTNSEAGTGDQSERASANALADASADFRAADIVLVAPAERRRFPIESAVLCDGKDARPERGDRIDITFTQHRELRLAGVVSVEWEEGDAVDFVAATKAGVARSAR